MQSIDENKLNEIKKTLTHYVLNTIKIEADPSDERLKEIIAEVLSSEFGNVKLSYANKIELANSIFNSLRRLDILEPLMQNPEITEIMVNGPDCIYIERNGKLEKTDLSFDDKETLLTMISCFFANLNRPLNETNPISDLRLPDGSRANAVLPPIAPDGPILTIRKFTGISHDILSLIRGDFISEEAARFLSTCVQNKKTIFLCGGTGSGKTTFLNTLSSFIPKSERVVTIEDSAELNLQGINNLVRMEARLAGPDGSGEITIRDMIKASLRMRPDRIIVGEVRGEESADMMHALNTGHPGSMCTGHANSCHEMLERLTGMVIAGSNLPYNAVVSQISMGIDLIIHITRNKEGKRFVDEISLVQPNKGNDYQLKTLYINHGGDKLECLCKSDELQEISAYKN